ncbi:MAG: DDE-type integrase/transposase/recombinase [Paludibacter sp.]|nr:DDE-type integrase/transposase/recombinase [Paludibacter sp.]
MSASEEFQNKTKRVNELWQTDFTYFKIVGWGWYYLSTILDDKYRFILARDLRPNMTAQDVMPSVDMALRVSGLSKKNSPKLLSDNGSCYIAGELKNFLTSRGNKPIHGKPMHPQTQGKIERYHRTMKNVVKLDKYYSPKDLEEAIDQFIDYYNFNTPHLSTTGFMKRWRTSLHLMFILVVQSKYSKKDSKLNCKPSEKDEKTT